MKIWEAIMALKPYQRLKSKTTGNEYELGVDVLYPVINGDVTHTPCKLSKAFFHGEYEIIRKWDYVLNIKCPNCGHEHMGNDWTNENNPKFYCCKCGLKLAPIN